MQSCCILQCDSYKSINSKKISYFKFPIGDEELLEKWLSAINQPDWTPNIHTQICEIHFNSDEIERPLHKYPYLKPDVVPSIFPVCRNSPTPLADSNLISQQINSPSMSDDIVNHSPTKTEIMLSPVIQATSVILSPTLVDQLPRINQTLVSSSPQRFRKILPKTAQNNNSNNNNDNNNNAGNQNDLGQNENPTSVTSNSYIIIIPTFDNSKPSVPSCSMPKIPSSTKKPILQITVGRRLREDEYLCAPKKENITLDVNNAMNIVKGINDNNNAVKSNDEEVVINNYPLNKSVVFTLDPNTGDIRVSHRPIENAMHYDGKKNDFNNERRKRITRSCTRDCKTNADVISHLNDKYLKNHHCQNNNKGTKKKTLMLRQMPKYELEEIEKLEEELLKYGNSINNDNNKLQYKKRTLPNTLLEKCNNMVKNKVLILDNLFKNNELTIDKVETSSVVNNTNRLMSIDDNLLNTGVFHNGNMDKNYSIPSNNLDVYKSTDIVTNECTRKIVIDSLVTSQSSNFKLC